MASSMSGAGRNSMGGRMVATGRMNERYDSVKKHEYAVDLVGTLKEVADRSDRARETAAETLAIQPRSLGQNQGHDLLTIDLVDFYALDNARNHHTDRYELVHQVQDPPHSAVLRRGQAFYAGARFVKRAFDDKVDDVRIVMSYGPQPNATKGTLAEMLLVDSDKFSKESKYWDVRVIRNIKERNTVQIEIQIPPTAPIGLWSCEIVSAKKGSKPNDPKQTFKCKNHLYIIFNPWCKDDTVYMEDEAWRNEYVMNDTGKVYCGSKSCPIGRRWVYGQFEDVVLPATMLVLQATDLDYPSRRDPVKVVRAIAAGVNHLDDNGVIEGCWSGNYADGTAPMAWTGSAAILGQYLRSGGVPVKYGQCWCFACVTTTICRALGIPCRTVTNFVSAHDSDETLTIDKFFDKEGDEMKGVTNDSIWNFHVWNDVWMARPDLPKGYGGWQAIDATPQEMSEAIYRAGPASVEAIRRGELGLQYDAPFVFAEVNADLVHWEKDEEAQFGYKKMKSNKYHVGQLILTKAVGKDDDYGDKDAENITALYKNMEGGEEERLAILRAAQCVGVDYIFDIQKQEVEDVFFDLIDIDHVLIGKPFSVTVKVENNSDQIRNVVAVLSASSVYYTGILAKPIKKEQQAFKLQPKQKEVLQITVDPSEYIEKLVDYNLIKIYGLASVKETNQTWCEEDDFPLLRPKISLQAQGALKVGAEFPLKIEFENPLPTHLTDCQFHIEGPTLSKPRTICLKEVETGATLTHVEKFVPGVAGQKKLIVTFTSKQLSDVSASGTFHIAA